MAFNIEAFGKDGAPVIDVTRLFTTDVPEFSGRDARRRARAFDATRSFIERAVSFPENIEVEATLTYNNPPPERRRGGRGVTRRRRPRRDAGCAPAAHSVVMHYSMVKLPEKPMMPRLFDERVGYFSTSMMDYGQDEHRAPQRRYITRWRLEKKDPERRVVRAGEADRLLHRSGDADEVGAVPEEGYRELAARVRGGRVQERDHREGSADAGAGSRLEPGRRALLRDPLAAIDDRECVGTAHSRSAHRRDPGGGHPVLSQRHEPGADWYFVQVGPLDPRAQKLPLPDD